MASTQAPGPQVDTPLRGDGHRGPQEITSIVHTTEQSSGDVHGAVTTPRAFPPETC